MGRWVIITLSVLDWALVVVLIAVIVLGFRRGFWISMGTVAGDIAGVFGGIFFMPVIVQLDSAGVTRMITMVGLTALLLWYVMWVGRKIVSRLRIHISHLAGRG